MDIMNCFIIQPFDKDKFDKRYIDTYEPAIIEAGFTPYRVDKDISSEIPIEDIDKNIRTCSVVLADITLDNPNVWFEVGLAIAYKKKTILICSNERTTKYPFDIQQRSIINYNTGSASDFYELQNKITAKLKYYSTQTDFLISPDKGQIFSESEISDEALILLGIIANNLLAPSEYIETFTCIKSLNKIGYNQLAFNFAFRELQQKKFIDSSQNYQNEICCTITDLGFDWMNKNKSRFNFSEEQKRPSEEQNSFPENIPF